MDFLLQILQWLSASWADLISFISSIKAEAPSWRALTLSAVMVAVVALFRVLALMRRSRMTHKMNVILVERGEDRFIRLTKDRMSKMGVREDALRMITVFVPGEEKKRTTVRVLQRKSSKNFDDDTVAFSAGTIMRLGLEEADERMSYEVELEELPIYTPSGLWTRTIGSPRQDHRITSWVTLLTTVVGISTSHFYYWLSTLEERPALRPSLAEHTQSEPTDNPTPMFTVGEAPHKSTAVTEMANVSSSDAGQ